MRTRTPSRQTYGPETLGRIFDVTGNPIDNKGPVHTEQHFSIHRPAPSFDEQLTFQGIEHVQSTIAWIG